MQIQVCKEPPLKYHPFVFGILTLCHEAGKWTMSGGQFDWGGRLLNCNGGVQRFPQNGWKSFVEYKGIRELDCDTDGWSR